MFKNHIIEINSLMATISKNQILKSAEKMVIISYYATVSANSSSLPSQNLTSPSHTIKEAKTKPIFVIKTTIYAYWCTGVVSIFRSQQLQHDDELFTPQSHATASLTHEKNKTKYNRKLFTSSGKANEDEV